MAKARAGRGAEGMALKRDVIASRRASRLHKSGGKQNGTEEHRTVCLVDWTGVIMLLLIMMLRIALLLVLIVQVLTINVTICTHCIILRAGRGRAAPRITPSSMSS